MKKMDWERVEGMTWEKLLGVYKVFKDNMMITWSMLMVIMMKRIKLIWAGHHTSSTCSSMLPWLPFWFTHLSGIYPWVPDISICWVKAFFLKDPCRNVYQGGVSYLLHLITYEHITAYCLMGYVGLSDVPAPPSQNRRQLGGPGCSWGDIRKSRQSGIPLSNGRLGCNLQWVGRRQPFHSYL